MDYVEVPAPQSAYVMQVSATSAFVDKVIAAESSGNAQARPRDAKTGKLLSSAYGAAQFIEATWLEMVKKHRPDLAVKRDEEILDLRSDFELSREMTIKFAEENRTYLIMHGLDPTEAALYLAHFAGRTGRSSCSRPIATPQWKRFSARKRSKPTSSSRARRRRRSMPGPRRR